MEYKVIEKQIDFNDPEEGFSFYFKNSDLVLSFINWQNHQFVFKFITVYSFFYIISEHSYKGLPEAQFIELFDSDEIKKIEEKSLSNKKEGLKHFIISTNEDEWCEILSEGYKISD